MSEIISVEDSAYLISSDQPSVIVDASETTALVSTEDSAYLVSSDELSTVVDAGEVFTLVSVDRLIVSGIAGGNSLDASRTLPAGEIISALNVVYEDLGQWFKASALDLEVSGRALFLAQTSATTGSNVEAICFGLVSDSSWDWNLSLPLLLGEGVISQSVPSSGMIIQVGRVLSPDQILFNPLSEVLLNGD